MDNEEGYGMVEERRELIEAPRKLVAAQRDVVAAPRDMVTAQHDVVAVQPPMEQFKEPHAQRIRRVDWPIVLGKTRPHARPSSPRGGVTSVLSAIDELFLSTESFVVAGVLMTRSLARSFM